MKTVFNANNYVYVKLTEKGKDIYYHQYDDHNKEHKTLFIDPEYPKIDKNGYLEIQLWKFMEIFGKHQSNGCELSFEMEILFKDSDLQELKP